jgi:tetratricopeptide (TPR) repeat protein
MMMSTAVVSLECRALADADAGAASQGDEAARQEFEAGRQAYGMGAFAIALAHFERSYALSLRPELLYNIGRAADAEGLTSRAAASYAAYLEARPDAENREFVRARLAKMQALAARAEPSAEAPRTSETESAETRTGTLRIVTNRPIERLMVDGNDVSYQPDRPITFAAGVHTVEAHATESQVERRRLALRDGAVETLSFVFVPAPTATAEHAVRRRWISSLWLWTAAGAVVAGAATGAAVALSRDRSGSASYDRGTWNALGRGP